MIAGVYGKLIGAGLVLAALVGLYAYGHHAGAQAVQAQWDAAKGAQAVVAEKASEQARAIEQHHANDFAGIASGYLQVTSHAYPSIADALPAAVAAGAVRLRDDCPAVPAAGMSEAAARSRAADAAAAAAVTQRLADSVAAVSAGDASDQREADFRALIMAQRAVLDAERQP